MSDYDVSLVNDNMRDFYVRFHGPEESTSFHDYLLSLVASDRAAGHFSTVL